LGELFVNNSFDNNLDFDYWQLDSNIESDFYNALSNLDLTPIILPEQNAPQFDVASAWQEPYQMASLQYEFEPVALHENDNLVDANSWNTNSNNALNFNNWQQTEICAGYHSGINASETSKKLDEIHNELNDFCNTYSGQPFCSNELKWWSPFDRYIKTELSYSVNHDEHIDLSRLLTGNLTADEITNYSTMYSKFETLYIFDQRLAAAVVHDLPNGLRQTFMAHLGEMHKSPDHVHEYCYKFPYGEMNPLKIVKQVHDCGSRKWSKPQH
jgi:hypothetical protein